MPQPSLFAPEAPRSDATTAAVVSPPTVIERHGDVFVVRDDLLRGGSKTRFVRYLIPASVHEVVYGAPFCGGAPVALAVEGALLNVAVTIFYARRTTWTARQQRVQREGALIMAVDPGYMTVVQSRAREYARDRDAHFLPLGFDLPEAEEPFVASIRASLNEVSPPEIWCATGSGMLARCLGLAMPHATIRAVAVGLQSRWKAQRFPSNVCITPALQPFERKTNATAPFPCCGHYDRKAWAMCVAHAKPGALMWNVLGDD